MHLLMVCLCLAPWTPASSSSNTSFSSMAAPLPPESSDWSPSPTTAILSRRGYPGPPRPRPRRKHRPSYQETMRMYAMRRHPLQRYPKYPQFLQSYSHNYKQGSLHHPPPPNYHLKPAGQRFHPQHNSYIDYPPYASHYQPTGNDYTEPTRHQPLHQQQGQHVQHHHPSSQQSPSSEHSQYSPQFQHNDQHSHLNNYQSPNTEYQQHPSQFQQNDQHSHLNHYQSQNTAYQQHPSQFLSNEQSYPPNHQAHNFEYPQLPPDYHTGEVFSQFPNENYQHIPEPHIPHFPSPEYMGSSLYSGSQQPSQMQPHSHYEPHSSASAPPEYNSEMAQELLELNKEIGLMQEGGHGNSSQSMLRLLVPLLMLGISIPAIGYMYSHMIRKRSFQAWSSQDTLQEFMEVLERGIECYQRKGECPVS